MSQTVTITCDVCGKKKGPSNSWFQVCKNKVAVSIVFDCEKALNLEPVEKQDVCGEECALRLIQKKLEESRNAR